MEVHFERDTKQTNNLRPGRKQERRRHRREEAGDKVFEAHFKRTYDRKENEFP